MTTPTFINSCVLYNIWYNCRRDNKRHTAVMYGSHLSKDGSSNLMASSKSSRWPDLIAGIHKLSTNTSVEQFYEKEIL